jgi:hypothetical protein
MRGWELPMFGDSFRALRTFFFSSSAKILFLCLFRGSFVVVVILHEQSPCALLRLSCETMLLEAFGVTIERLEVEEKLAVAKEVCQDPHRVSAIEWKNLRILACLTILLSLLRVLVEKASITDATLDRRHIRRIDILLGQTLPSDLGEPRVVHDIATATVQVAQTLGQIMCDELREQVLGVRVDIRRILDSAFEDVLVNL